MKKELRGPPRGPVCLKGWLTHFRVLWHGNGRYLACLIAGGNPIRLDGIGEFFIFIILFSSLPRL